MYNIGEYVVHKGDGVCEIIDIERKSFYSGEKPQEYYILKSVYNKEVIIYVPVNNCDSIRKVLDTAQIHELILDMPNQEQIKVENAREKNKEFRKNIVSNDPNNLIRVIRTLYLEKLNKAANKNYSYNIDIMQSAEKLLYEEFAFALGIDTDDVLDYIIDYLNNN